MRIIAGAFRRASLRAPEDESTRPTTDRVRTSIFNLLTARTDLDGAVVLDLFAGTGALGLEALSRGAQRVTFVEANLKVLAYTRGNAEKLGVERRCEFVRGDAVTYLQRARPGGYDVLFADPPYELPALADLPALALPLLNPGGVFVLEHAHDHSFDDHPHLDTSRKYGRTIVSVFTAAPADDPADDPDDADFADADDDA